MPLWRIELFGGLRALQSGRTVIRFRTAKTASLLAYLACHLDRSHPREALADLLWPEADRDAALHSLRTALSSLRRQLEPVGSPLGSVLEGDRASVGLNPAAVTTDVAEFREALRLAESAPGVSARARFLADAAALYTGPLLAGHYDDWVLYERE